MSTITQCIKQRKGFTLIELLVVVGIIGILFAAIAIAFNPAAQIEKAHNANRQQDLNNIKSALDTYLNDTGCYPTSLPFGSKWAVGSTVYMEKVPQDPDCSASNPTDCYDYQTNGSACPQWNILYATMHKPIDTGIPTCMLSTMSGCLPSGGIFTYNYCSVSGKLDCSYLSTTPLPTPVGSGGGGSGGSGGGGTITPVPTGTCSNTYPHSACTNKICDVEDYRQCSGCGGSMQCYPNYTCSNVNCNQ